MRHVFPAAALIFGASFVIAQSTRPPRLVPGDDPTLRACYASASTSAEIAQQIVACKQVADAADMLPANAPARVNIYTATATALSKDRQFQESLRYANKAVDSTKQSQDDLLGASSAYAARAVAEVNLSQLAAADQDQSTAEEYLRAALRQMDDTHVGEFHRVPYTHALKGLLTTHAQMLTAQGKTTAAQSKTDEAAKLQ